MNEELKDEEKWYSKIKWFFFEILKMYSAGDSFFSKKRIESGIAFIIMQWGMIYYLVHKLELIGMSDFIMWCGVELAITGYMISKIQQEKTSNENK